MNPPDYRQQRRTRLRVISAILAISLAAPPLLFALQALRGFGAGIALLVIVAICVLLYRTYFRRPSGDREG